jgi:hypothetical protein
VVGVEEVGVGAVEVEVVAGGGVGVVLVGVVLVRVTVVVVLTGGEGCLSPGGGVGDSGVKPRGNTPFAPLADSGPSSRAAVASNSAADRVLGIVARHSRQASGGGESPPAVCVAAGFATVRGSDACASSPIPGGAC